MDRETIDKNFNTKTEINNLLMDSIEKAKFIEYGIGDKEETQGIQKNLHKAYKLLNQMDFYKAIDALFMDAETDFNY